MTFRARALAPLNRLLRPGPRGPADPPPLDRATHWRAVVVLTLLASGLIVLLGRVVWIQVLRHDEYALMAVRQQFRTATVPAPLGRILDREYRILATSIEAPSICADPAVILDKGAAAGQLAAALGLDAADIRRRLISNGHRRFIWVARKVSEERARRIDELNIRGVWQVRESKRQYPSARLAAHAIGFRNLDNVGLEGLERVYDRAVRGKPGYERYHVDAFGRRIVDHEGTYVAPEPGLSVVTSLDLVIQHLLEGELDQLVERWDPVAVCGIVMAPHTGEVLALSNRPTYSLAAFGEATPDQRRNRCLTDPLEPGSTFKPFVASAVLQHHLSGLDDRFFCHNGLYVTHGRRLRDHHAYPWLTFREIVGKSSNIGMARLGEMLGPRRLQAILRAYGFGRRTGIDLPGEDDGKVTSPRAWSHYTTTSVPMGHEVSVTPLQLITGFCAIANDGYLPHPHLARCLVNADGEVVEDYRRPVYTRRAVPAEVARMMVDPVLTGVVETGTGRRARLDRYRVFGKTGTAQKLTPDGRSYSHSAFVASFIGAAPAEHPEICVLIMVNEPRKPGSRYGGTVAAPSVARVIEKSLDYLHASATAGPRLAAGPRGDGTERTAGEW